MKFPSHYIVVLPCDTPVAEFDASVVNLDTIINCALHIGDQFQHKITFATDVAVVDANTGEIVWNYRDNVADGWHTNEKIEWEDVICDQDDWIDLHEDFDEDMGFDPYLGCYTDDC